MEIFGFEDYRHFLTFKIKSLPKGELGRIARHLSVHPSYLSQVSQGAKNLSPEQGWLLARYFNLGSLETQYLDLLISYERASKKEFREHVALELSKVKTAALSQWGLAPVGQPLDERNQIIFYSNWYYSAIQLASGVSGGQTSNDIANRLKLDPKVVKEVLQFLVSTGLCKTDGKKYSVGLRRTHLKESSPIRLRHQTNWRLKALEKMSSSAEDERFYTGPMRIDQKTYELILDLLTKFTQDVSVAIDEAGDQELACLNIDFFKL